MPIPKSKFVLKPYVQTFGDGKEPRHFEAIEVTVTEPMSLNDIATYIVCGNIYEFTQRADDMTEEDFLEYVEEYFWENFDTKTKVIKAAADCFATDGREVPHYRVGDQSGGSKALAVVLEQVQHLWDRETKPSPVNTL